jgi:BirA family biotin operon repressor/biotin-[acetyl-CoA-carboxylase] ligase
VWKQIRSLRNMGIEIQALTHQGYRFPRPVQFYDAKAISEGLSDETAARTESIDVLLEVDSTNRFLSDAASPATGNARACVAEIQTAGRGRRGRSWIAPFGGSICLSVAWQFADTPPNLPALSLAVGVALIKVLHRWGCEGATLKWPNDLWWQGRKLGGILLEMKGESAGPARVVIGIGFNIFMPAALRLTLAEKHAVLVADLHEILGDRTPDRNQVVSAFVQEIIVTLQRFEREGFAAFRSEWSEYDGLANLPVKLMLGSDTVHGVARGVAEDGALLLESEGEVKRYVSGDVSVRAVNR